MPQAKRVHPNGKTTTVYPTTPSSRVIIAADEKAATKRVGPRSRSRMKAAVSKRSSRPKAQAAVVVSASRANRQTPEEAESSSFQEAPGPPLPMLVTNQPTAEVKRLTETMTVVVLRLLSHRLRPNLNPRRLQSRNRSAPIS